MDLTTTRRVVDLLPDREEQSLITWLRKQPKPEVITRDLYGKYRRAATKGAPLAIQVTDRWHLLKTLGEAPTKMMPHEYTRFLTRSIAPKIEESTVKIPDELTVKEKEGSTAEIIRQRFHERKKLQAEDLSIKGIAVCPVMAR